ncbi:MAG TPA: hypothetical protein VLG37_03710 [Candidatus Saccharimonadales bacterium]|nr:hypothetical protein [Candidatus Saccharimonadales bacterium]
MTGNTPPNPNDPPNTFPITPEDANPYGRPRYAAQRTEGVEHDALREPQRRYAEALADVNRARRELIEAGVPPERTIEVLKSDRVSGIPLAVVHPLEHSRTRLWPSQIHPFRWLGSILTRGADKVAGDSVTPATYADGQEHHGNITPTINKRRARIDERTRGWIIKDFKPEEPTLALRRSQPSSYRDRDLVVAVDGRSWLGYQIPADEDPETGKIGVGDSRVGNFPTMRDRAIERLTGIGSAKPNEIPPQIDKLERIAAALRAKLPGRQTTSQITPPDQVVTRLDDLFKPTPYQGPLGPRESRPEEPPFYTPGDWTR